MGIVYRPLKERREEIRLLELEPAPRLDDPLRGTLRHARLHEASYCALSYVWGQSDRDRSDIAIRYERTARQYIASKLHGNSSSPTYIHSIGSSLAAALRNLRQKYGRITIWADALCINQMDNEEKSWQVPLMKSIYSEAKEVHAWLGPRYDEDVNVVGNVNAAFSLADTVWDRAAQIKHTRSLLAEEDWLEACFTVASPYQSSDQAQRSWTEFSTALRRVALSDYSVQIGLASVKALSQNDYFARMWILQETGRASKLTFHYGLRYMSHRRILLVLGLANSLRDSQDSAQIGEQLRGFDTRFLGCLAARTTCAQGRSLRDVLAGAYFSPPPLHQAGDIKDLVYARLGLADNPRGIKVDYSLSIAEVYTAASRFLLVEGFLEPLVTFKPYRFQQWLPADSLPSWAYDWSKKGSNSFDRFSAAQGTSQQVSITPYRDTKYKEALFMKGINIGHVNTVNERFSVTVTASGLHKGTIALGSLRAVSEPLSGEKKRILTQKIKYAYRQLNTAISDVDIESLFSYRSLPFASFWCWWVHWIASLVKMIEDAEFQRPDKRSSDNNITELLFREVPQAREDTENMRQFGTRVGLLALVDYQRWSKLLLSRDNEHNDSEDSVAVHFAESLFRSAWGMRPAVLDTGRLGYVPEDTKPQDQVVIFYGVKAPLVIRKITKDAYRIVGPAHVCGVMQGELMDSALPSNAYKLV
ncbi:hypothetical protein N0V90_007903 [Kalmusia sp. IMI 367209]|nr:hypothetical protein N0V90_007903 [Kalmusia sp. IMI 367209]